MDSRLGSCTARRADLPRRPQHLAARAPVALQLAVGLRIAAVHPSANGFERHFITAEIGTRYHVDACPEAFVQVHDVRTRNSIERLRFHCSFRRGSGVQFHSEPAHVTESVKALQFLPLSGGLFAFRGLVNGERSQIICTHQSRSAQISIKKIDWSSTRAFAYNPSRRSN